MGCRWRAIEARKENPEGLPYIFRRKISGERQDDQSIEQGVARDWGTEPLGFLPCLNRSGLVAASQSKEAAQPQAEEHADPTFRMETASDLIENFLLHPIDQRSQCAHFIDMQPDLGVSRYSLGGKFGPWRHRAIKLCSRLLAFRPANRKVQQQSGAMTRW